MSKFEKKNLPNKSENLSDWYNKVIQLSELADYGPAKGTMIYRPYGYALWEAIQAELNRSIRARGVDNAYFPLFIPERLLNKEKQHIKGFSPELAVVTIGGGEELTEKLIVRPTSETIMYEAYARWIQSWRDLPLQINQWNNVVRWEKRTYLFLRTSEFLWQEGHTAHATHVEAGKMVSWAIETYAQLYQDFMALPGYVGEKSESEKFAGADKSLSYEILMPEGKILQSCTAHDLGQNFSKPFNIQFQDKSGQLEHVWQTSWGLSTRSIGAMIMVHGDDQGLRLPPKIAPLQVVVIPIRADSKLVEFADKINETLLAAGVRSRLDDDEGQTLGYRINKWELKGVPIRLEIGPKELVSKKVTAVRRDDGVKCVLSAAKIASGIEKLLVEIQESLYRQAQELLSSRTFDVDNLSKFIRQMEDRRGFIRAYWCERTECENKIRSSTMATTRCRVMPDEHQAGLCVGCGENAKHRWYFGLAY